MLGLHWERNFTVTNDDIDYITNLLVEQETPRTTEELARVLIERRLQQEREDLAARYQDAQIYNPAQKYEIGERVIFSEMDFATATVTDIRTGSNPDYGDFSVIAVDFDSNEHNSDTKQREFAAELQTEHTLSRDDGAHPASQLQQASVDEVLEAARSNILRAVHQGLNESPVLRRVAGYWFPSELVIETDIGTLHLAEAVLDMMGGGPLTPQDILEQIGGLGEAPAQLQTFSLNLALSQDDRFDEVGPAGEVLWYLNHMEPADVLEIPPILRYTEIPYNDDLLSDEMFDLETELDDEWTPIEFEGNLKKAVTTLIYPHRRAGTLPLSAKTRQIFPSARTPRIYVDLIDKQDGERFAGWVVHEHKYIYGFEPYYTKHRLPVGTYVSVEKGDNPGEIIVSHEAYRPRTEWIRLISVQNEQIAFENKKRSIGADYDDLVIVGVDDLEAVDKLGELYKGKSLTHIIRVILADLSRLSPQGTVHVITLYSAVNVIRRCPPGPIFATLQANPDFQDVGDHYWKLSSN